MIFSLLGNCFLNSWKSSSPIPTVSIALLKSLFIKFSMCSSFVVLIRPREFLFVPSLLSLMASLTNFVINARFSSGLLSIASAISFTILFSEKLEKFWAKSGLSVKNIASACLGLNVVMSLAVPWYITLGVPSSLTILLSPNQRLNAVVSGARIFIFGLTLPSLSLPDSVSSATVPS